MSFTRMRMPLMQGRPPHCTANTRRACSRIRGRALGRLQTDSCRPEALLSQPALFLEADVAVAPDDHMIVDGHAYDVPGGRALFCKAEILG